MQRKKENPSYTPSLVPLASYETAADRVTQARLIEEGYWTPSGTKAPGLAFEAISAGGAQSFGTHYLLSQGKTFAELQADFRLLMRMRAVYMQYNQTKAMVNGGKFRVPQALPRGAYFSYLTMRELSDYSEVQLMQLIRSSALAEHYFNDVLLPGIKDKLKKDYHYSDEQADAALREVPRVDPFWFQGFAHRILDRGSEEEAVIRRVLKGHRLVPGFIQEGYWYSNFYSRLGDFRPGDLLLFTFFNDAVTVEVESFIKTGRFLSADSSFNALVKLPAKGPFIKHLGIDWFVPQFFNSIAKRDDSYANLQESGNLRRELFNLWLTNFNRVIPIPWKQRLFRTGTPPLTLIFWFDYLNPLRPGNARRVLRRIESTVQKFLGGPFGRSAAKF